jgi:hypothetical protein
MEEKVDILQEIDNELAMERGASERDWEAYHKLSRCINDKDFCKEKGIRTWADMVKYVGKSDPTCRKYRIDIEKGKAREEAGKFNISEYLLSEQENIARSLVMKATAGNVSVQAIKLIMEQLKELVDASGKTVELSIDDRHRIGREVVEELRRSYKDTGDCPVCGRCEVLSKQLCVDKGREQQAEGEVAELAVSDGLVDGTVEVSGS